MSGSNIQKLTDERLAAIRADPRNEVYEIRERKRIRAPLSAADVERIARKIRDRYVLYRTHNRKVADTTIRKRILEDLNKEGPDTYDFFFLDYKQLVKLLTAFNSTAEDITKAFETISILQAKEEGNVSESAALERVKGVQMAYAESLKTRADAVTTSNPTASTTSNPTATPASSG